MVYFRQHYGHSVVFVLRAYIERTAGRFDVMSFKATSYHQQEGRRGDNRMDQFQRKGFPLIGVVFFALGAFKLLKGDDWVVWIIIGVLFGGLGAISRRNDKRP